MSKASKRVGDDSFDGMVDENGGDPAPKVKPPKVREEGGHRNQSWRSAQGASGRWQEMLAKYEVAVLVARVARQVVRDMGIKNEASVDWRAMQVAYRALWGVDKYSVEMMTDRFKVKRAMREAVVDARRQTH